MSATIRHQPVCVVVSFQPTRSSSDGGISIQRSVVKSSAAIFRRVMAELYSMREISTIPSPGTPKHAS